ncbi:hypothetical protein J5N97_021598 [Dioscorea zingiberensis]|uniref:WEB family protein n=1 Tax=Dioscorea zingiberensis TaxID=325984 RepID=A0A9D5C8X7_9LILI|nr:hypothetical protein J5N97_021598 [Dioscorea zingiberensis]
MESEGGGVRRAEIDTRAPFRSVKEAVLLFGEKVLAGEVYANKLSEMKGASNGAEINGSSAAGLGLVIAELEETKQSLEIAKEHQQMMETSLTSLREELEKTKHELNQLKTRESEKQVIIAEIGEDVKFAEESTEFLLDSPNTSDGNEFQKRRYVKFAEPPSLAQVLNINGSVLERQFSHVDREMPRRKNKKKPLRSLIKFFSKKGHHEV